MHDETLLDKQKSLLPLVSAFAKDFCLIGGTAVSLQLGHRRSIDFDLATTSTLDREKIRRIIRETNKIEAVAVNEPEELTLVVNGVKMTFLQYPFNFVAGVTYQKNIQMPDILALGAMKAYALGRRAKWKDYVDIYYIAKVKSFMEIVARAKKIFKTEFNERLFREQICYFNDVNYSEEVDYMPGFEKSEEEIQESLKEFSLQKQ